jgi:hypothetical protein
VARYVVVGERSTVTLNGRSSLHPISAKAAGLRGYIDAAITPAGVAPDPPPAVHIEVPVANISSGNALEDSQMRKLLSSRVNPSIVADLRELTPLAQPNRYAARGAITINGKVKEMTGEVTIAANGSHLAIDGEQRIDIRDFGIQPPQVFMLKVFPDFTISLHLEAAQESHG